MCRECANIETSVVENLDAQYTVLHSNYHGKSNNVAPEYFNQLVHNDCDLDYEVERPVNIVLIIRHLIEISTLLLLRLGKFGIRSLVACSLLH